MVLWLLVKIKQTVFSSNQESTNSTYPHVTLLIAAYNEEDIVEMKMANNRELEYTEGKLAIVWVTDGSTDDTVARLKKYEDATVYHIDERGGKTKAINRVMPFIKSPITVYTDANTILNTDSIIQLVHQFEDPNVGCVAGEKRIAVDATDTASSSGEGFYWRYESALKTLDYKLYSAVGAAGELYAIRTSLFEPQPCDALLDDFMLSMQIAAQGYKIAYCPQASATEYGSADMKEEEKRKVRIAAGGLQSIWRLRKLLNVFRYGVLTFQYVSHRVLRWSITPFALVLLLPLNVGIVCMTDGKQQLLYIILLLLQIGFYILGFFGYYLAKRKIKNKILFIPYYFLFMNINVFKGIPYLIKKKNGTWDKARRKG
jgi:cellulose synthase/poly-beta-1,6-N-acetylglucosamine synthase-like glycosyltransferase